MFQRTFILPACENSRQLWRAFTSEQLLFELEFQEKQEQVVLPEETPLYHPNHKVLLKSHMAFKQGYWWGEFGQKKLSPNLQPSVTLTPWMIFSHQTLRRRFAYQDSRLTVQPCQHWAIWQNWIHHSMTIKFSSWRKSLYLAWELNPP